MKSHFINIIGLILLLTTIQLSVIGQESSSLPQLIKEANSYFEAHTIFYLFDDIEIYPIDSLPIDREELRNTMLEAEEELALLDRDSVEEMYAQSFLQEKMLITVNKVIHHPDFSLKKHLELLHEDLGVTCSGDGKLCNLFFYENTGGSWHSYTSWMYHEDLRPFAVENLYNDPDQADSMYQVPLWDGFEKIYTLDTEEGRKYLALGSSRTCNTCQAQYVSLMRLDSNKLVCDFRYQLDSRGWEETVIYDEAKKEIHINYETDDIITDCYCEDISVIRDFWRTMPDEDQEKKCSCVYRFDGSSFVLVSESATLRD